MRTRFSLVVFFLLVVCGQTAFGEVLFSETEWALGKVEEGVKMKLPLLISNTDDSELQVSVLSTCSCLSVEPAEIVIKSGSEGSVTLVYDTTDESGEIEKYFIIRTNRPGLEKAFFLVTASIPAEVGGEESEQTGASDNQTQYGASLSVDFYYSPGCRTCIRLLEKVFPRIQERTETELLINELDITDPAIFEKLQERISQLNVEVKRSPVLIVEQTLLQGESEIINDLEEVVYTLKAGGGLTKSTTTAERSAGNRLLLAPVILAGLLDGINPCAFTTLIFLLAALTVAGKSRREVLVIGLCFTLSVLITYFLIGLGLFKALRLANSFPLIATIIRWVLFAVLVIFAALSLYDYLLIRRGRAKDILLQLPDSLKKRIHSSVRQYSRSTALVSASISMGFLVSVFELACTGQVYFPTITYLVRTEGGALHYLFLVFYNLAFILPLVVVFAFAYAGVSSQTVTVLFQKHMGKVKVGTAVLFAVLAVVTVLT